MHNFSIILPVRNGGQYVKDCVQSLLAQTYQQYNIIILDNNSNDGTVEWLQALQNQKITIYTSAQSLTIEQNWARVLTVPTNEFITLIGHDDILQPNFLATIQQLICLHPNASLYHTHFNFIKANGSILRPCKPMNNCIQTHELVTGFLNQSIDSMGTGYVMRLVHYQAIGGIPTKYPNLLFADFELWINATAKGYMVVSPKNCFAFRVHQSVTSTTADSLLHKALSMYVDFLQTVKNNSTACKNAIDTNALQFLLFYTKGFCHRLLRTAFKSRNQLTVNNFVKSTYVLADKLGINAVYFPEKKPSICVAIFIDSNPLTRILFLWVKKVFKKPLL
jgi:Glycosyl transferase family 2